MGDALDKDSGDEENGIGGNVVEVIGTFACEDFEGVKSRRIYENELSREWEWDTFNKNILEIIWKGKRKRNFLNNRNIYYLHFSNTTPKILRIRTFETSSKHWRVQVKEWSLGKSTMIFRCQPNHLRINPTPQNSRQLSYVFQNEFRLIQEGLFAYRQKSMIILSNVVFIEYIKLWSPIDNRRKLNKSIDE